MTSPGYDLAAADPHYLDSAGRHWGISAILKINIITCSLSFVGSLVMIVPFILFKQLRKIRHRLILGMAVNDLLQAASVLVPSAWSVYHGSIATNSPGCNADSFFYLTFVVAGCFWTLVIAITTYVTLVQPMSKIANLMHQSRSIYYIWITIWLVCTINAAIGTALNLSVDGGGFCFFPSVAPYLYGNLVLFVPRAGTFAIIILIYVRLYIFFRQQASSHHKQESGIHEASFHVPLPTPASEMQIQFPDESSTETGGDTGRPSGSTIASTRRLSALVKASSRQQQQSVDESTAILRSKLAQYQFARGVPRNESEDSALTVRSFRQPGWLGGGRRKETSGNRAMSSEASPATASEKVANQGGSQPVKRASAVLQDSAEILNSSQGFEEQLVLLGQDGAVRGLVPREMPLQSPPEENASLLSGSTSVTPSTERDEKLLSTSTLPPRSPLRGIVPMQDGISPGSESLLTLSSQNQVQVSNGFPGLSMPSASTKQQQGENTIMGLWEALASVDPVDSDDAGLVEACAEKGRRLSASEENRRVSYLMLLYPLAYGIILAVSIARLAVTLVTKASPSPWLQILNRVCVLGTGVVDACIYTIIEWRFRASSQAAARSKERGREMQMN